MGQANTEIYAIHLDLVPKVPFATSGLSTQNLRLSTQYTRINENEIYIPIVEQIRYGNKNGDNFPQRSTGRIVCDNSFGSFNSTRRLSDFFDLYTPMLQEVLIYRIDSQSTDTDLSTITTLVWKDIITGFTVSSGGDRITFTMASDVIEDTLISYVIGSEFPLSAPLDSQGVTLPLVWGENKGIQVKPSIVEQVPEVGDKKFGYATVAAFETGGVDKYFIKDFTDEFIEVDMIDATTYTYTRGVGTVTHGVFEHIRWAMPINVTSFFSGITEGIVLDSARAYFANVGTGAASSFVKASIIMSDTNLPEAGAVIAEGTQDIQGNLVLSQSNPYGDSYSEYYVEIPFSEPAVLDAARDYWLVFEIDLETIDVEYSRDPVTAGTGDYHFGDLFSGDPVVTATQWYKSSGNYPYELNSVRFTDDPDGSTISRNSFGLRAANTRVQVSFTENANKQCDVSKLDMILEVSGYKDTAAGELTGTANGYHESVIDVVANVMHEWNGAAWIAPFTTSPETPVTLDRTFKSSTHTQTSDSSADFFREVSGYLRGQLTRKRFLQALMTETACRLVRIDGEYKALGLWCFGEESDRSTELHLFDNHLKSGNYRGATRTQVVNDGVVQFDREIIKIAPQSVGSFINRQSFESYGNSLVINTTNFPDTSVSKQIYGIKTIGKTTFDLVSDSTSMTNIIRAIVLEYDRPRETVVVEIPYPIGSDIKPTDIIKVASVTLPYIEGADNRPLYGLDPSGDRVAPAHGEGSLRNVKTHRIFCEDVEFNYSDREGTMVKVTGYILQNESDPT